MSSKKEVEFQAFKDITDSVKAEWRAKYGDEVEVVVIPVKKGDRDPKGEKARFVVVPPTRNVVQAAGEYATEEKHEQADKVLMGNCVLGGDMKWLEPEPVGRDRIYRTVLKKLTEMLTEKRASVEKL